MPSSARPSRRDWTPPAPERRAARLMLPGAISSRRPATAPYFGHSLGHSLGIEVHESPSATPANDKPLPLHAVISVEPGIYLPGRFGVRIEDVVVLEEDGCRNLMELGKDLEHM